ncbi:polysaccharide lyase [Opitutus terrae]|uniref:Polysaccharide lyase 14 domain-containing protein n=1 Tax=Opitutus terrae (strain DSM 11246 / JCM 15787 / PB90-1) TaxID=452637 RepID=B1ZSX7_OPITP|nr:hypothetical protein [Opitutus terrae]ACB75766.1 hypothetical protein Oter_2484 [Opitutus terrae PB90-1]
MRPFFLPLLLLTTWVAHAAPAAWSVDYARWPAGQAYTKTEATRDWPTLQWFDAPSKASIAEKPANSDRKWLRVDFPAGKWGGPDSGVKFAANLAPADSYTLEYEVYFPPEWEFSQNNQPPHGGGKLPGISGGSHPSGGLGKPDGMSVRPMWRRDTRFSAAPQNYLELYLYWPQQTEKYGDRFFAQDVEAGRTYRIKLRVDLGTPERDGLVKLWIDGALRVDRAFRFLQPGQSWKLTQYMHNVFYGGNDPTWAPAHDQYLLLGPVRVDATPF